MKPYKRLKMEGWGRWKDVMGRMVPQQRTYTVVARVNKVYSVRVYRHENDHLAQEDGDALVMSITRVDGRPIRGAHWKDLQLIKKEMGYGEYWACEWYPPDDLVQDPANIYYLFLWPKGHEIPTACCITAPKDYEVEAI